jgi:hypothetical protein
VAFNNRPLPGATIALSGATTDTTTTDLSGHYGLTGFADGSYTLTPSKSGFLFTPASISVTVSGTSVSGKDFTAANNPGTISYSGSVVDSTPRAFEDAIIEVVGNSAVTTTSDSNGNFILAGIPAGTDFSLKISSSSSWYLPAYSAIFNSNTSIRELTSYVLHGQQDFTNYNFFGGIAEGTVVSADNPLVGVDGVVVDCTSVFHPTNCSTIYPIYYARGTGGVGGTATSTSGTYYITNVQVNDTVTVTATKNGWQFPSAVFNCPSIGYDNISEIFNHLVQGDLNGNGTLDLSDAITGLKILSRQTPQSINTIIAVNSDGKIGMAEVIYILQKIAGLR